METIKLDQDIKVFCVNAKSFPEGIPDAHKTLRSLISFSKNRRYFGLSRPEGKNGIVYKAAAEELFDGESEKFNSTTLYIKKGNYVCLSVTDLSKNPQGIKTAFLELLSHPNIDPQGYCVECYMNNNETVNCIVRLDA